MASLIDYPALAIKVQKVIEGTGRDTTFIRNGEAPVDSAKPWRQYAEAAEESVTAKAVVDMAKVEELQDNFDIRTGDKVYYVSAKSIPTADLTLFDSVVDEGQRFEIVKVEPIKPGAIMLLFIVQARR